MDKKIRVLVAMDGFLTGGEEKSLIALYNALSPDKYEITQLLMHRQGELLEEIPAWVKLQDIPIAKEKEVLFTKGRVAAIKKYLREGRLVPAVWVLLKYYWRKLFCSWDYHDWLLFEDAIDKCRIDDSVYDVAMVYTSRPELSFYVDKYVNAKKKVQWFHSEVSRRTWKPWAAAKAWRHYDVWAAACSDEIRKDLERIFPDYQGSIVTIPMIIDVEKYRELASMEEGLPNSEGKLRILTVARLSSEKGISLAVEVAAKLKEKYGNFLWYVVGEGRERERLSKQIASLGLGRVFILLGNKANPYPYFQSCDIYVQPSLWEGYCLTLAEARAFSKAIVSTDFAGARDQLVNGETGLIVKCNVESILGGVERLMEDVALRDRLARNVGRTTEGSVETFVEEIEHLLCS